MKKGSKMKIIPEVLLSAALALSALTARAAPVPRVFEADVSHPGTHQDSAYHGESLALEAHLVANHAPFRVPAGASAMMLVSTNSICWWSWPASVTTDGVIRATWIPACDVGADSYRIFLGVSESGTNVNYGANMLLRLLGSPGETPNALPLPVKVLDFARISYTNEPWSVSSGLTTNDVRQLIGEAANNPYIPDWGGFITNRLGFVGFPEGYPYVDLAYTNGTGGLLKRMVVTPDKIMVYDGSGSNYYSFPRVAGNANLNQTIALRSDLSGYLASSGDQELTGTLEVRYPGSRPNLVGGDSVLIDNSSITIGKPNTSTTYANGSISYDGSEIALPGSSGTLALDSDLAAASAETRRWTMSAYGDTNNWIAIEGKTLGFYSKTNSPSGPTTNTLWESSSALGGELAGVAIRATNNTTRIAALEQRPDLTSWGDYAPDGSPNPDAEAVLYLNKALTLMGSGFSWATSGAYACLCQSGAVAYHTETNGEVRIGLDVVSNYFGMVQGGSVTVGCMTHGIRVEGSGDNTIVHLLYAYAGGEFPVIWGMTSLAGDKTELAPVWTDYGDGTAEAAVPGHPFYFFTATSSRSMEARFESKAPAAFPGGIYGGFASPPVKYDTVITIQQGGHTYRIPAELVQ